MGDVGKGTAMHEGRCVLGGLYQVGIDGILHQYGDGTATPRSLTVKGHRCACIPAGYFRYGVAGLLHLPPGRG